MAPNIAKMISEYITKKRNPKTIGRYYPSEIGYCLRKNYYSYFIETNYDDETRRIFEVGNILHSFIYSVFKNNKNHNGEIEYVQNEKAFISAYDFRDTTFEGGWQSFLISGRADDILLINNREDGKEDKYVVEVKTVKDLFYINEPSYPHKLQLQYYLRILSAENKNIKGILLYIQKDNLDIKTFELKFDKETYIEIIHRVKQLDSYLKKLELPPKEAANDSNMKWQCGFCQYAKQCAADENSGKKCQELGAFL
jgi:CRISPR-associated exonuclease Cas4